MARRGSRNSRKKKSALELHDEEAIRLVVVEWMDEVARIDRERRERIAAEVADAVQREAEKQYIIEQNREQRKATAKRRTEARRQALREKTAKSPRSRNTLKKIDFQIRGPAAYRVDPVTGAVVERY